MPIRSVKGDIFEVGPQVAEVIAVWLRSGFNMRAATWQQFVERHAETIPQEGGWEVVMPPNRRSGQPLHEQFRDQPWRVREETLCEMDEPIGRLKYIYFFPNPGEKKGAARVEDVNGMVRRCLDSASGVGARSVALRHIPAVQFHNDPTDDDDRLAAEAMVEAVRAWLNAQDDSEFFVQLVDLSGDFEIVLGNRSA